MKLNKTYSLNWFQTWFDSPYYHLLYKSRNSKEAERFLDNLIKFLKPKQDSLFLDLACGRGRYSVYLNQKGFNVIGVDLSETSIKHNLQFANETLSFFVHDMREEFKNNYFDYVFNLFTSFGYFEKESENLQVIQNIHKGLKTNGILVIDYMNTHKVISNLVSKEIKLVDDIQFNIERKMQNEFIFKQISFSDKRKDFVFYEKVRTLVRKDFEKYFNLFHFKILNLFGDYSLSPFDQKNSDRLILIAQKI